MPLTPQDIAALSRLADDARSVPEPAREAWLQSLPPAQAHLLPALRRLLADLATGDGTSAPAGPPALPALPAVAMLPGDPPGPGAGDLVGPYRLIQPIGRGGMGEVWRAARADGLYEREVALKLPALARHPSLAQRMARERQIGARLEHPHIARLYDAGIDDQGRPFLVMEWIRGLDLVAHAQAHRLSRAQRLGLLLQACAGVAHAHAQLVVHRDIKPSNILVDAEGQVKLLDFGIARWLGTEGGAGGDSAAAGADEPARATHTPGYAAPEQRLGGAVTIATDVYALGAVAHRLLLDRLPGDGPPAAQALGPELAAVLACALQQAPEQRYSSVDRLADDLRRVLEQRPVQVAPASWRRRGVLFARRHRRALAGSAAALLLTAGAAALALERHWREREQAERVAQAREFLMDVLEDAEPLEHQADAPVTAEQLVQGALQRAREGFDGQPALRGTVLSHLGFMLRRLHRPEQALQVLAEARALLHASADRRDPSLHIASGQLALQMLEQNRPDLLAAGRLGEEALQGCRDDSVRCARARLYARQALRGVAAFQGDERQALDQARQAVAESERAFGPAHAETAMARLTWAQMLRNAGQLQPAAQVLAEAAALAEGSVLRAADRLQLSMWRAIVDADLGRHGDALERLRRLLEQPSAAPERPALLRMQSQSHFALGHFAAARDAARAALDAAVRAADDWHAAFARLALARALALLGEHPAAAAEVSQALASLQAQGVGERSITWLRAQRVAAEVALRAGDDARAQALLAPLPALHGQGGAGPVQAPADLAQVLDLLGVLERRAGRLPAAAALHAQAGPLWQQALPAGHPLRLRHALDAALADGRDAEAALARYLQPLPADSGWRSLLAPLAGATPTAVRFLW